MSYGMLGADEAPQGRAHGLQSLVPALARCLPRPGIRQSADDRFLDAYCTHEKSSSQIPPPSQYAFLKCESFYFKLPTRDENLSQDFFSSMVMDASCRKPKKLVA
jgi:hypothetical protein